MNHLGHFFLSFDQPEWMFGNFAADFLRGKALKEFPERFQKGIDIHREIDRYTDNHPAICKMVESFRPSQGRYAPVTVDILLDHLLVLLWDKFGREGLDEFLSRCYECIRQYKSEAESLLESRFEKMLKYRFLEAYKTRSGLYGVMHRVDHRAKFQSNFTAAVDILYDELDQHLAWAERFFTDAIFHMTHFTGIDRD